MQAVEKRVGPFRVIYYSKFVDPALLLQKVQESSIVAEQGRGGVRVIEVDGLKLVVRKYWHGGLFRAITRDRFRSDKRVVAEAETLHYLREIGLPVVAPFCAIVEHSPIMKRLYLVTVMEEKTANLLEYVQRSDKRQRLRMARKLAQFFWSLEQAGVYHRDLHLRNVLVTPQETLILLDFDRARKKRISQNDMASMFLRLGRFLEKMERQGQLVGERKEKALFLRVYDRLSRGNMTRRLQGGEMRRRCFHTMGWLIESFLYSTRTKTLLLFLPVLPFSLFSCAFLKTEPAVETQPRSVLEQPGGDVAATPITGGTMGSFAGMTGGFESEVVRSQEETNRMYGYVYDRGISARIESVKVSAKSVHPRAQVDLMLTYMVFSHSHEPVQVREVREVWFKDRLWESSEVEVERAGGTYESIIPLYLPGRTEKGRFKIVCIVQTPFSRDLREAAFTVNGN